MVLGVAPSRQSSTPLVDQAAQSLPKTLLPQRWPGGVHSLALVPVAEPLENAMAILFFVIRGAGFGLAKV
jgi:hypothetical protein